MAPFKSICITALATLLVVAAGATAHHMYETHLSSGYASIFKAAMTGSYGERAQYIHEARVAVRTDKDRQVEAKLEKMQLDEGEPSKINLAEAGRLWAELRATAGLPLH
jgi:hypothetical protein